eukprot:CAMPEP_0172307910 /NCGR_PEP_ID=MMETSP1058-20130122/8667_1 /TAXON_ID=83371 /ORGANISM="Detonula confervacea, Strain CCMP 353" /LENGTH=638 /DNA_ID=CAMNT_0013020217 /DNA_START=36 /DNA_END=1952 /DNA_ORIENTATION=+
MTSTQQLSLTLPTGSLGLGIQQQDSTGLCIVTSKSNAASPLRIDDVILSLNGIGLADVEGGVDAWVSVFVTFASGPRNVVIHRAAPAVNSVPPSPLPVASSALNSVTSSVPVGRPYTSLTAEDIARMNADLSVMAWTNVPGGAYRAGIIAAITELKDRTGSSSITIKKHMQANLPANKKWLNGMFLNALKKAVADGVLAQVKASYKLSADYKKMVKESKNIDTKKNVPPKNKTNHVIATSKQPAARVVRVSLSPEPIASAFAQHVTTVYNTAPKAPVNVLTGAAVTATAKSKPPLKPNFWRMDIARKASELANATNKPSATTTNAALLKLQQEQQSAARTNQPMDFGNDAEQKKPTFASLPEITNTTSDVLTQVRRANLERSSIYRARIIKAITNRKNYVRSAPYIKKDVRAAIPRGEKWSNAIFTATLQKMVNDGDLVQDKFTYKLGKLGWEQPTASMAVHGGGSGGASFVLNAGNTTAATNANYFVNTTGTATASTNGSTNQAAKVTVFVTKPSKGSSLGLNIQQGNGSTVRVVSVASDSLFIGTNMRAGMLLETINGSKCTTTTEAVTLIKAAEGQITIVAAVPPTAQVVLNGGTAAAPTSDIMERRMAAARAAAGYTGHIASDNELPILSLPHP